MSDPNPRPDIYGKVGNSGVSIATLDDLKVLYSGFDLCDPATSVSMTINGPAPMILAMYLNAAIDQQVEKFRAQNGRDATEDEAEKISYAAKSWDRERRLITRLEFGAQGTNPRFIVTNLDRLAEELYDDVYCQRGEAENRIKETQLDLFGTRASCHKFLANWLRILFSALAYTLMQRLRELALATTELAKATAATIRVRLLKIGAAVIRNTRRIRILLASHHPLRDLYFIAANALASP